MILELDCGNSLIKWRLLGIDGAPAWGGVVDTAQELVEAVGERSANSLLGCRLVSVRSDEETAALVRCIESGFGVGVECARSSMCLGGVRNGYHDYSRLGLDRWLAVVGAYKLAGRACLVLDLGTAVTSDFVTADGEHLGGYICPGMPLMRRELGTHTRRIRYDDVAAQQALLGLEPGRTTAEAVERGCALMLRGFVLTQLEVARGRWGDAFSVYLTGGDAALVRPVLPQAHLVSDLVFIGLAEACPFPGD